MNYKNNQYFSYLNSYKKYIKNINMMSLIIFSLNVRSISSIDKFNKFKSLITQLPWLPNIIAIQETWLSKDLVQLYNIAGYKSIHCCRPDGYGGTSIFIQENLQYTVDICESTNFFDSIIVTLNKVKVNGKPIKFISFYRSQKCKRERFLLLLEKLLDSCGRYPCLFAGDSNIDILNQSSSEELINLLNNYNLKNCHNMLTRSVSGSSIDHIYSNVQDRLNVESIECDITDHNIIVCRIGIETQKRDFTENNIVCRDYKRFKELISISLPAICQTGDPSTDVTSLISCVNDALENSTTKRKNKKILRREITPWITENLRKLIAYKTTLLRQRRKNRENPGLKERLTRISKIIKKATKESLNNYYINKINQIQQDPKKMLEIFK